jgi:hypothetical protein
MSEHQFKALTPAEAEAIGYERSEPNTVQIGILTVVIVVFVLLSCFAVYYWYVGEREAAHYREVQVPVWQELKDVRAYETERLTQYKYIDKAAGKVQLPVSRAMELLIEESAAGKSFYSGANAPVKPYEPDAGLQAVLDKALGKPTTPAAPAAPTDGNAPAGAKTAAPAAGNTPAPAPAASKH